MLDVTANPDFSQVESDEPQITANQRFEVFFPEKRPFFLENANYFRTPINLVFTRRIADPQFGIRLTGKTGPYAIGGMLIDDEAPGKRVPDGDPRAGKRAGFGIFRVSRDVFSKSNLGVIFTDREFDDTYNRAGGVDGRWWINNNWSANFQAVVSSTRLAGGKSRSGPAYEVELKHDSRKINYTLIYNDRGKEFIAPAGFIPRANYRGLFQGLNYQFRPEGKFLIAWEPYQEYERTWNRSGNRLDWTSYSSLIFDLARQSSFSVYHRENQSLLAGDDLPRSTRRVISFARKAVFVLTLIIFHRLRWTQDASGERTSITRPSPAASHF